MSTTTVNPQPSSVLDKLLAIIELGTAVAAGIPATSEYAQLASQVEQITQTAISAHEQISGQPYDPNALKPITPIL